jgi:hypothetical protein
MEYDRTVIQGCGDDDSGIHVARQTVLMKQLAESVSRLRSKRRKMTRDGKTVQWIAAGVLLELDRPIRRETVCGAFDHARAEHRAGQHVVEV